MRLQYIDQTCVGITSEEGVVIVVDPVEIGGFGGPGEEARMWADIAIMTWNKDGAEGGLRSLKGDPMRIEGPGPQEIKGIKIVGHPCPSPEQVQDSERGVIIYHMDLDGIRLLHTGKLNHVPNREFKKQIGPLDLLFIPVGGYGTLNSAQADDVVNLFDPRVVVPMHRPSGAMGFEMERVDIFLKGKKGVKKLPSKTEVSRNSLPNSREIWILAPTK